MKERNKRRKSRNYWNNSEGKKKPKFLEERKKDRERKPKIAEFNERKKQEEKEQKLLK